VELAELEAADQRVRAGEGGLMVIVVVLFATVLLRAAIVMTFVYLMLPAKRVCPHCGAPLTLIQHAVLRRLLPSSSTDGASTVGGAAWCGRFSRA